MTARFTLSEAALAAGARVLRVGSGLGHFEGVFTDSRKPEAGALFVALRGERHEGAAFALQAARDGAGGVLIPQQGSAQVVAALEGAGLSTPVLACTDTTRALGGLGRAWRGRFAGGEGGLRVVAITGSAGKTSTKELVASVLAADGPTLKTEGNLNNEIGVPLTLLRLEESHRYAAVECGMNHLGEIARLGAAVDPDVGLVTNVGPVHLEGCGSIDGVGYAKGELFHGLRPGAIAVANADDPRVLFQARLSGRQVLTFGASEAADVRLLSVQHGGPGLQIRFSLRGSAVGAELQLVGLHNGLNACAAAAAGVALGLSGEAILHGLAAARTPGRRMRPSLLPAGALLLDDCYNANPSSTAAALETVRSLLDHDGERTGRALLVLGDMLELGPTELELHASLGAPSAALQPALLVAFGQRAASLADAAIAAGLPAAHVVKTHDPAEAAAAVQAHVARGDVVLVKGSRGMKMERISDRLTGTHDPAAEGVH
jgi:UDP-N-acetylmuramoyl-tripeptide--D-alanyl-D-alanine ligase